MKSLVLLDKFELAEYLNCHAYQVWRLVREGRLADGRRYYGIQGCNTRTKYWTKTDADKFIKAGV